MWLSTDTLSLYTTTSPMTSDHGILCVHHQLLTGLLQLPSYASPAGPHQTSPPGADDAPVKHYLPVHLKSWRQREPTAGAALPDMDLRTYVAGHDPPRCSLQLTTDEIRTSPTSRLGCADTVSPYVRNTSRTTQRLGTFVVHLHSLLHRQQQHGHVVTCTSVSTAASLNCASSFHLSAMDRDCSMELAVVPASSSPSAHSV